MRNYWVFGSSRALGTGVAAELRGAHKVVCFSRSVPPTAPDTIAVDFSDADATKRIIRKHFTETPPDGVVFCQRYRPDAGQTDLDAIKAGLDVELAPVLSVIEAARTAPGRRPLSLVLLSSVAGQHAHADIPLHYHLLKATTLMATKALATSLTGYGIRVNCVVLGEFEKYTRETYTAKEQAKYQALEQFTLDGRMCQIADIAHAVTFLLSENAGYLTGQTVNLDGNLSNLSQESIIRVMTAKNNP